MKAITCHESYNMPFSIIMLILILDMTEVAHFYLWMRS